MIEFIDLFDFPAEVQLELMVYESSSAEVALCERWPEMDAHEETGLEILVIRANSK